MATKTGDKGTRQGREVEVAKVNSDGTLNLTGADGTTADNVPANEFTADAKPEPKPKAGDRQY